MTTTDFIKLLTENEYGGATGRPREVMFEVDDEIFETDGVKVTGSGDGLFAELYLSLPSAKRKTGKCTHERLCSLTGETYPVTRCSVCQNTIPFEWEAQYCPNCGAKMETEG